MFKLSRLVEQVCIIVKSQWGKCPWQLQGVIQWLAGSSESTKLGSNNLTSTEAGRTEPIWVWTRSSVLYSSYQLSIFMRLLNVTTNGCLSLLFLGHFSLCWVVISNFDMIVWLHHILFCHVWLSLSNERKKGNRCVGGGI